MDQPNGRRDRRPRACVFAPSPLLTVTMEPSNADVEAAGEVHLHAGGQGFWIARLLSELGIDVVIVASFGGETGLVLQTLISQSHVEVRGIDVSGSNGSYVHDRRSGERIEVASMPPAPLTRHEVDELYGAVLIEGIESDVCVLGGPAGSSVLPADTYRRLAADLRRNGATVVVDLAHEPLDAALEGGVSVLKVSHQELQDDGRVDVADVDSLVAAMRQLADEGADHVVVTRAEEPALALIAGEIYEVTAPRLEALDERGAGDSLTAGIAAALARGASAGDALRLGAAAGAMNVTRRGLATGRRDEIERLADHVDVRRLDDATTGTER